MSLGDEHITRAADFGDDGPYVPTNEEICQKLIDYCLCEAGLDYVGPDAVEGSDHGHTACFFLGWAIKRLRAEAAGVVGDDTPPPDDEKSWMCGFCYRTVTWGQTPVRIDQHAPSCEFRQIIEADRAARGVVLPEPPRCGAFWVVGNVVAAQCELDEGHDSPHVDHGRRMSWPEPPEPK